MTVRFLVNTDFAKLACEQSGLNLNMLRFSPSVQRKQSVVFKIGLAVLPVGLAILSTSLLGRFMDTIPLFYAAVIISSWHGGRWSGLFSVLLATLAVDYYFVPPSHRFTLGVATIPYLGSFALLALIITLLSTARKRAEESLRQAHDEMEATIRDRTADLKQINEKLQAEIAERRRIEEALRERANLVDLTHDTVFVRDVSDVITYWNRGAEEQYGWSSQEAVGRVSHHLLRTAFPAPLDEINVELTRTGRWEGELVHTRRDGTKVVVASRWALQFERGNPISLLETNNDITERKRAEESLRESERRYRHIFQTVGVSLWEEDFSGVKAAIDGLKAQGVRNFREYLAAHPEFVRQATSMVKILDVNDVSLNLFGARNRDELQVSLHKVFLPETEEAFARELIAIAEGRISFESETVLESLKGDQLSVLLTIRFPPPPTELASVLVSITDITERKRAEEALSKAQAELAHITRVMTMGELTASIAHEINQPLSAVITNGNACLRWLTRSQPNLEEAKETVQRIIRDGKRASEVIAKIRALLKRTATSRLPLDINEVIQETVALTQIEAGRRRVSLRTDFAPKLPLVLGDRVQLQQVILNLMMNGMEAMSSVTDRPRELLIKTGKDDSAHVLTSLTDSGIGLDPEHAERLFEAFFTTKTEGMGMGLSISRSIIEAHGGRLWAIPNDEAGATFQFTVPIRIDVEN